MSVKVTLSEANIALVTLDQFFKYSILLYGYGFDKPIGKDKIPLYFTTQYAVSMLQEKLYIP